ncbi:MAG TPA: MscL family protein [Acidimicrobiales bacterium]|jgi:large conductance mechanosensitive channel
MKKLWAEFKDFMNQGDFVTIAVGLIIALQTVAVVKAIIDGIISPILSAIVGKNSFDQFGFDIGDARISIGLVLAALINFVVILAIVFLLLKAWNAMKRRTPADDVDTELSVLREIRDSLNRGA